MTVCYLKKDRLFVLNDEGSWSVGLGRVSAYVKNNYIQIIFGILILFWIFFYILCIFGRLVRVDVMRV